MMMKNTFKKANIIISAVFFVICLLSILMLFMYNIDTSGDRQYYAWFEPLFSMFSLLGDIFGLVIVFIVSMAITVLFAASQLVFFIIELVNKYRLTHKDFVGLTVMNSCFFAISVIGLFIYFIK